VWGMSEAFKYHEFVISIKGDYDSNRLMVYILTDTKKSAINKLVRLVALTKDLHKFNQYKLTEVIKQSEIVAMREQETILYG
jgi:hypothetical protein